MGLNLYIRNNKKKILQFLFPSSIASVLGVATALHSLYGDQVIRINLLFFIIGLVITVYLIIFLYIELVSAQRKSRVAFDSNQSAILNKFTSLSELAKDSTSITLLGGTFKSFTDKEENLNFIALKIASNAQVRILMLAPDSLGVQNVVKARKTRYSYFSPDKIENEIKGSLERLSSKVGISNLCKIVRLYEFAPTSSIYKFDTKYLITTYLQGRGASSPAFYIERDKTNEGYCNSLDIGLDELWNSKLSRGIDIEYLHSIGIEV